ncbi:MAG TPA: PilN domain-containing protein [Kineosporiaceae bacterium]
MTTSTMVPDAPAPEPPAPVRDASWAPVPQVDLLPPEIVDARRFRAVQRRLAAVALVVAALCGLGVVWAQAGVARARSDLAIIQAEGGRLQAQQARYAGVPTTLAELDHVKAAREAALANDVAWYRFLADLAVNTPPGTELTQVTITMDGKSSDAPLTPAGLGTVTVQGTALKFTDVAAWLEDTDQVHGLAGSGLTSAVRGGSRPAASGDGPSSPAASAGPEITFSGSAVVVPAALSHRYDRKAS